MREGQPSRSGTHNTDVRRKAVGTLGILMVNETPDSGKMGWSGTAWTVLMYFSRDEISNMNCLYTYNIMEGKENKILCDENINDISDSININKNNVIFDINREDDFKNQLSDVFLLELK